MIAERFSGKRKIIEADSLYLYDQHDELTLCFMFKELDFDVKISHRFKDSGEISELSVNVMGSNIYLKPVGKIGIGTSEPIEIATVGEKKLYMHLWSYPVNKTVRKVEYTVFASDT